MIVRVVEIIPGEQVGAGRGDEQRTPANAPHVRRAADTPHSYARCRLHASRIRRAQFDVIQSDIRLRDGCGGGQFGKFGDAERLDREWLAGLSTGRWAVSSTTTR